MDSRTPESQKPSSQDEALQVALAQAQAQIVEIEEIVHLGRWDWDIRTDSIRGSDRLLAIYGYEPGTKLVRDTFLDAVYPEDREHVGRTIETIIRDRTPYNEKYRIVRLDGAVRWIYTRARLEYAEDGLPVRMVGTTQDITDRETIEADLRRSERLFREMAEHIREVFWLFDWREQRVIYASPAYETIWGRPLADLYGRYETWGESIHPEDRESATDSFRQIPKTGGDAPREYRIVRPDGETRWISDRGFSIHDDAGDVLRIAGIAEDVTDRKNKETERQVLQSKIQHSQKLESLGVLAGGIAHDFNNLLMAILGNADLALNTMTREAPGREFVEIIEQTAQRAVELTNQMLAYSGKGRFVVEPISLGTLVEEMTHLLETVISKKADLRFQFQPDLPLVEADASQVRQVVMNLIINGSEALEGRPGTLQITTGAVEGDRAYLSTCYLGEDLPEGTYVYLEVTDTGIGMTDSTRRRIFDPFFTTKFAGRGLGLAAVLGIIRGHKGTIDVQSQEGVGTGVRVLFPASVAVAAHEQKPSAVPERELTGALVLLAEDDRAVRDVTSQMLSNAGLKVVTVHDGQAAVERYAELADQVSVVILDLIMPVMDGEETLRAMRQTNAEVPVILSSGYTEQEAEARFAGAGLSGFIQKPYRASDLLAVIHSALSGGESSA